MAAQALVPGQHTLYFTSSTDVEYAALSLDQYMSNKPAFQQHFDSACMQQPMPGFSRYQAPYALHPGFSGYQAPYAQHPGYPYLASHHHNAAH